MIPSNKNIITDLPKNKEYVLIYLFNNSRRFQILSTNDIQLAYKVAKIIGRIDKSDNSLQLSIYDAVFKKDRFVWWFEDQIEQINPKLFNKIIAELDRQKVDWDYC